MGTLHKVMLQSIYSEPCVLRTHPTQDDLILPGVAGQTETIDSSSDCVCVQCTSVSACSVGAQEVSVLCCLCGIIRWPTQIQVLVQLPARPVITATTMYHSNYMHYPDPTL